MPRVPPSQSAFTLTELMVAAMLGGLLIAAAAQVIVSHTRMFGKQMEINRLRSDWGRLIQFLAVETAEGDQISTAETMSETGCPSSLSSLFSVRVPLYDTATTTPTSAVPTRMIHYDLAGSGAEQTLRRCGPAILSSGQLNASSSTFVDSALIQGISISVSVASSRSITITPSTLVTGSLEPFTLRTKVRMI